MKLRFFTLLLCSFYTCIAFAQPNFVGLTRGNAGRIFQYTAGNSSVAPQTLPGNSLPWYNDLIQGKNGLMYGMAEAGGKGFGIIFSYDPSAKQLITLHEFEGGNRGASPYGSLVEVEQNGKSILYGMTQSGGTNGMGTIFSFDVADKKLTVVHSFSGGSNDGRSPYGSLTLAKNGLLYGMTESGGASDMGTVFSFDPNTNIVTLRHSFNLIDGRSPYGSLIQASDDNLYGMAQFGGANGYGVIFAISPAHSFSLKASFNWTDGAWPNSTLVEANGKLFGITESGGANNYGAIFSLPVGGSTISKVSDFDNTNGRSPYGKLTLASDNKLYGMTFRGGADDKGVIFNLDPAVTNATITPLVHFTGTNGMNPAASLTEFKAATPLPLTLTSFTAREENQKVKLLWEVEKELDIEKYEVERSTDGSRFTSIGFVAATNSQGAHQYRFTDEQPATGPNYYRLKIYERFEAPHYSAIRLVNTGIAAFKATVQPNPVRNNTQLLLRLTTKTKVQLQLYSAQGVLVKQWPAVSYEKGEHNIPLQLGNLAPGSYVLLIDDGATRQTLQLIKSSGN